MRHMLKGKIHRATVTGADLAYEGSVTIDPVLLEAADMVENEQVHIFDIDNGQRLVTYIIEGERGKGEVVLNGAAARLVSVGDKVIVVSYTQVKEEDVAAHQPHVILVDGDNKIVGNSI